VRIFDALVLPDFRNGDEIDAGALVEVEMGGEAQFYLLVPASGGLSIFHDGVEITLLTPASGLYRNLLGLRVGDTLDAPRLSVRKVS
jgi:hypothetical protein